MSEQTVNHAGIPGWFGKLPSLGDFAWRRLPDDFVHVWDEWLQHGLASLRDARGEDALDRARACRFWLATDMLGASSWMGVVVPSRDRVDRRFPLTVAVPIRTRDDDLAVALASREWFDAVERTVQGVVERRDSIDALERELAQVAAAAPLGNGDAAEAERLAATLRADRTGAGSVWWRDGARDKAEFVCAAELPDARVFAELFSARRVTSAS